MTTAPEAASSSLVVLHPDAPLLAQATASRLLITMLDAQSMRTPVHVVLTGGSMGIRTLEAVAGNPLRDLIAWEEVHLWWGDERFLPTGHAERNETQARKALLRHLPLDPAHIHPVAGPDVAANAEAAAAAYADELASHAAAGAQLPDFAVVLLGVGPDGHVASLFPHHATLAVTERAVVVEADSPKPPPQRVSLSLPALNSGRQVWFVAAGRDKGPAVTAALTGRDLDAHGRVIDGPVVPAGRVRGRGATLWLLDVAAAADLPY